MNVQWNKLIARVAIWMMAEVMLNLIGLDTLADYSEFFFEHQESRFCSDSMLVNFNYYYQ
ncbi:MAG: hypothetical protein HC769_22880 [Cyanobacteria bacterium CRU_2_1]|nr:hypothetical protein [Cyanobacteria bacterium CRU_2_1]